MIGDHMGMGKTIWILHAHEQAGHEYDAASPFGYNNSTFRPDIRNENVDAVKFPLENEFDPDGGVCKDDQSTFELAYRGSEVQFIMKDALLARRE
jgi:hypothetical protein